MAASTALPLQSTSSLRPLQVRVKESIIQAATLNLNKNRSLSTESRTAAIAGVVEAVDAVAAQGLLPVAQQTPQLTINVEQRVFLPQPMGPLHVVGLGAIGATIYLAVTKYPLVGVAIGAAYVIYRIIRG